MKKPEVFIAHINESIETVQNYLKNVSKAQFLNDKKLQDAVIRRLEIIGEATKNLPSDFIKKVSRCAMGRNG